MNRKLSKIIVVITLIGLFIPMTQQLFGYIYIRGLDGVIASNKKNSTISWWDRSAQSYIENYSKDSLSLKAPCVRLKNQFEFTFFDKINAHDIYEYDGVFYRYSYYTYNEKNSFVGMEKIQRQVKQLKAFQDKINKDSIPIYVIITPTKLHQYNKQLPWFNQTSSRQTNYIQYKRLLQKAGINVLDADAWFLRDQKKFVAPTQSTGGVHWTLYGGALAMDSLVKRIRKDKKTDFQMVQMEISKAYELYPQDMDAVNLSNLMYPPKDQRLRLIHFPTPKNQKKRIKPVIISDSYFHVIDWTPLHDQIFDPQTSFYYYFNSRKQHDQIIETAVNLKQVSEDIQQSDCIIIITDIMNLEQFGFGFIEKYCN
jgi:SGNH hydrolase-like domain, acetyltransferase AlgX